MKKIVTERAPVLHQKAEEVPVKDIPSLRIQKIIREMSEVLHKAPDGIGIAAPQIGYTLRMFLASEEALRWQEAEAMPEEERKKQIWQHFVFINPVIIKTSKRKTHVMEGCLSIPGKYGKVGRAEKVTIEAYNEQGKKFRRGASQLFARVMQHEVDHLNGILFIEKAKEVINIEKKSPKESM